MRQREARDFRHHRYLRKSFSPTCRSHRTFFFFMLETERILLYFMFWLAKAPKHWRDDPRHYGDFIKDVVSLKPSVFLHSLQYKIKTNLVSIFFLIYKRYPLETTYKQRKTMMFATMSSFIVIIKQMLYWLYRAFFCLFCNVPNFLII